VGGLFEVFVLSGALLCASTWVLTVLAAPERFSPTLSPRARTLRARLWLFAPLWVPPALLLATVLPGLVAAALGMADHCLAHGGHHHHLCLFHPPHIAARPLAWTLAAASSLPVLALLMRGIKRAHDNAALSRALVRSGRRCDYGSDVRLLDDETPLALTTGVLHPKILLSRGLTEKLGSETLTIVLAHERAHLQRKDTAWALLDQIVAALLPAKVAGPLLDEISLAREQACDEQAALHSSRPEVAAALTRVARLGLRTPAFGLSVAATALERRVHYLLETEPRDPTSAVGPLLALTTLALAGAGPVHDLVERVVAFLLH
jgi:Zn-dependent protease with chaperone function